MIVLAAIADAEYGGVQQIMPVLLEGLSLAVGERGPTTGQRLGAALHDILSPVLGEREELFVSSKDLLAKVQAGGLPWIDSAPDLAKALSQFGLHPRSNGVLHGYDITKEWLEALNKPSGSNTALGARF